MKATKVKTGSEHRGHASHQNPIDIAAQSVISSLGDSYSFLSAGSEISHFDGSRNGEPRDPLLQRLQQGFHGRIRELSTLKDELKNVQNGPSRAVWVSGVSGVGKTSLVNEALANHPDSGHYFVMGKFDPTRQRCEPYSALIEALAELNDRIGQPDSTGMERKTEPGYWGGLQMHHLTEIISNLSRISMKGVAQQHTNQADLDGAAASTTSDKTHSFVQFKQLCRTFLSSTASADHPIVMFLDDLQWADEASLMVLDALLNDGDSRHVLLVGAYREDELSGNPTLSELIANAVRSGGGFSSRSLDETVSITSQGNLENVLERPGTMVAEEGDAGDGSGLGHMLLCSSSSKHGGCVWPATMIKVRPLNARALHTMIKAWTQRHDDEEETWHLSQVVWNKTHGNTYFVVQFMAMMVRKGLLVQMEDDDKKDEEERDANDASFSSLGTFATTIGGGKDSSTSCGMNQSRGNGNVLSDRPYVWDIDLVQQLTNVSDNVMDHVVGNLRSLSPTVQAALVVAALLGFSIHIDLLLCVLQRENKHLHHMNMGRWTRVELEMALSVGSREGLIEQRCYHESLNKSKEGGQPSSGCDWSTAEYKFTHDRVPSALCSLVPRVDEQEKLHLHIGRALLSTVQPTKSSVDWLPPLAADHLNQGVAHMESDDERLELMKLNLRVAKASLAKCAFGSAADYLQSATTLFEADNLWGKHYTLALDLFSTLAEAHHYSGNFQASKEVIDSLLSRTQNVEDGLRSYLLRVEAMGATGEAKKGRDLAFTVLEELGVVFPKKVKKWHVIVEFIKIQCALKGQDPRDHLLGMKPMTDPKKAAAMNILSNIISHTFMIDSEKDTFSLLGLRLMRLTLKYGLNEWSPSGIAAYAIALAATDKYKEAYEVGSLAKEVSDKLGRRSNEARHLLYLNQLVMHWQRPLTIGLTEFPLCYDLAMQHGDVDTGLCAVTGYFATALQCSPLGEFEPSFRQLVQEMYDFDHQTYLGITVPMWQFALNMLGQSDDPLVLTGEAMDYEEFQAKVLNQNHALALQVLDYLHLVLAYRYGDQTGMMELLPRLETQMKVVHTHFTEYLVTFKMGMSYFALLRHSRGKRRRYRRLAFRCTRRLRKWANHRHGSVVSCRAFAVLMDAVRRSLSSSRRSSGTKKYERLKGTFDESIEMLRENHCIAYLSMACEEAAWWARVNGQIDDAKSYLQQAVECDEKYECEDGLARMARGAAVGGRGYNLLLGSGGGMKQAAKPYQLDIEIPNS